MLRQQLGGNEYDYAAEFATSTERNCESWKFGRFFRWMQKFDQTLHLWGNTARPAFNSWHLPGNKSAKVKPSSSLLGNKLAKARWQLSSSTLQSYEGLSVPACQHWLVRFGRFVLYYLSVLSICCTFHFCRHPYRVAHFSGQVTWSNNIYDKLSGPGTDGDHK